MSKVIILKGLPASGKTTWAKELVSTNPDLWIRINKDDLRMMMNNYAYSKTNERLVLNVRDLILNQALLDGRSVIIDDTNLSPRHEKRIKEIVHAFSEVMQVNEILVEIKEFDVDPEICIARDKLRAIPVGASIIRRMAAQCRLDKVDLVK